MDGATEFAGETDHRVTPLELFFDLVFVFAFTFRRWVRCALRSHQQGDA
jgi:hypothetical protein